MYMVVGKFLVANWSINMHYWTERCAHASFVAHIRRHFSSSRKCGLWVIWSLRFVLFRFSVSHSKHRCFM